MFKCVQSYKHRITAYTETEHIKELSVANISSSKTVLITTHITLTFTRFYIFKLHNKKKHFKIKFIQTLVTTKQQEDLYFL